MAHMGARADISDFVSQLRKLNGTKFDWQPDLKASDDLIKKTQQRKMSLLDTVDVYKKLRTGTQELTKEQMRLQQATAKWMGGNTVQVAIPDQVKSISSAASRQGFFNRNALTQDKVALGVFNDALKATGNTIVDWGKNVQWAGRQLTVGLSVPLAAAAAAAGAYYYSIDKMMNQIERVYNGSTKGLRDEAMRTANFIREQYGSATKDTLDVMGQLAATGLTGGELEKSTVATMKLAALGNMDYNTAVKASIATQTAFKQSSEELGNTINYMNQIENETSLSMDDFAEAIPRAASSVQALGGDVKDLGAMMVALKAGGVDAAVAANSIKSLNVALINPNPKAKQMFENLTGKNLDQLVTQTKGEVIPTLLAMGDAFNQAGVEGLPLQQFLAQLGGRYQVDRLVTLFEAFSKGGKQVGTALKIAQMSNFDLWVAAQTETIRMQQSAYKQWEIALDRFKTNFLGLGEAALEVGTWFVDTASDVAKFFNGMPEWAKKATIVAIGLAAIAGPLIMLGGLFGNAFGQFIKFLGAFGRIFSKYRGVTMEQKAAELASKTLQSEQAKEKTGMQMLIVQLDRLEAAYRNTTLAAKEMAAVAATGNVSGKSTAKSTGARQIGVDSPGIPNKIGGSITRDATGKIVAMDGQPIRQMYFPARERTDRKTGEIVKIPASKSLQVQDKSGNWIAAEREQERKFNALLKEELQMHAQAQVELAKKNGTLGQLLQKQEKITLSSGAQAKLNYTQAGKLGMMQIVDPDTGKQKRMATPGEREEAMRYANELQKQTNASINEEISARAKSNVESKVQAGTLDQLIQKQRTLTLLNGQQVKVYQKENGELSKRDPRAFTNEAGTKTRPVTKAERAEIGQYLKEENKYREEAVANIAAQKAEQDKLNTKVEKTGFLQKAFNDKAMLGVSAVAGIGSYFAAAGSGAESFFNIVMLISGALAIFPNLGSGIGNMFKKGTEGAKTMLEKVKNSVSIEWPNATKQGGGKMATAFSGATSKMGKATGAMFSGIKTGFSKMGAMMSALWGPWGIALAAAGIAAAGLYMLITKKQREAVARQEQLKDTTGKWAEALGFVEKKYGDIGNAAGGVNDEMIKQGIREAQKGVIDALAHAPSGKDNVQQPESIIFGEVERLIGQGVDPDKIKFSMRTLLEAAGKTKGEIEKIMSDINVKFDFTSGIQDFRTFRDDMYAGLISPGNDAMHGLGGQMNDLGKAQIDTLSDTVMKRFISLNPQQQRFYADGLKKSMDQVLNDALKGMGLEGKNFWDVLKERNINFDAGAPTGSRYDATYGTQDDIKLAELANRYDALITKVADLIRVNADAALSQHDISLLFETSTTKTMGAADAVAGYNKIIADSAAKGKALTEEEKDLLAASYAAAAGLDAQALKTGQLNYLMQQTGAIVEDTKKKFNDWVDTLKGYGPTVNEIASGNVSNFLTGSDNWSIFGENKDEQGSNFSSKMQGIMSGAQNDMLGEASRMADEDFAARLDAITKSYDAKKEALEQEGKQADKAWDKRMDAFDERWDQTMDNHKKTYEGRKKAIEDEAKAQEKAIDDQIKTIQDQMALEEKQHDERERMFDAEEKRLQRQNELLNARIDYNRAIAGGNLDEAAKITNNMMTTQSSWTQEDSRSASNLAYQNRREGQQGQIDSLNNRKDGIQEAKQAKLDALAEEEQAVQDSLNKQKDMERKHLEEQRDMEKERLQNRIDSLAKEQSKKEETERKKQEAAKRAMETELRELQAFIPRNEAELNAHKTRVEEIYQKYGIVLVGHGNEWGGIVGRTLQDNVAIAQAQMSNEAVWRDFGTKTGNAIAQGAFGMTIGEFMNTLITGRLPDRWSQPPPAPPPPRVADTRGVGSGQVRGFHGGGFIGGAPSGRAGKSGGMQSDEVPILAQRGEFMMKKSIVDSLGIDTMRQINEGKIGFGGPSDVFGGYGLLGGMFAAGMMQLMMQMALNDAGASGPGGANAFNGQISLKPGNYGGVNLSLEQLQNANTIASVGKSLGASGRDILIALMTAMQESTLRNLNYGDRDSLGLFQQRAAWGSVAERTNPVESAKMFFLGGKGGQRGLFAFPNRNSMALAQAAQAVQVSAFPGAYAKWEAMAAALLGGGIGTGISAAPGLGWFGRQFALIAGAGSADGKPIANGKITSPYGWRTDPINGTRSLHDGIDYGAPAGTPIMSVGNGTVIRVGDTGNGFGNWTLIDHGNGLITGYAHQSSYNVKVGDQVRKGQIIGAVGSTGRSTGPHLHFQAGPGPGRFVDPRSIIPGLAIGGTINFDNTLANLHKNETVLTEPLSRKLKDGINNIDQHGGDEYNFNIDLSNAPATLTAEDVADVIEERLRVAKKRTGKIR